MTLNQSIITHDLTKSYFLPQNGGIVIFIYIYIYIGHFYIYIILCVC